MANDLFDRIMARHDRMYRILTTMIDPELIRQALSQGRTVRISVNVLRPLLWVAGFICPSATVMLLFGNLFLQVLGGIAFAVVTLGISGANIYWMLRDPDRLGTVLTIEPPP